LLEFFDLGINLGLDTQPVGDRRQQAASLVTSGSASRLICRSSLARLSAAALIRFWVINMKVERKMASTDATIAKVTKEGSNLGTPSVRGRD